MKPLWRLLIVWNYMLNPEKLALFTSHLSVQRSQGRKIILDEESYKQNARNTWKKRHYFWLFWVRTWIEMAVGFEFYVGHAYKGLIIAWGRFLLFAWNINFLKKKLAGKCLRRECKAWPNGPSKIYLVCNVLPMFWINRSTENACVAAWAFQVPPVSQEVCSPPKIWPPWAIFPRKLFPL